MGLIDRLRILAGSNSRIDSNYMREAADALERLKGYAMHDDGCAFYGHGSQPACSCGLTALLKEIEGHD